MGTTPATRPRFSTVKDVAHEMRVSEKTVRRWIKGGDLRHHRIGRQLRVSENDLSDFISRGQGDVHL